MKIAFVNRMMGIKFGGGENFDLQASRALKRLGHSVMLFAGRQMFSKPLSVKGVDVTYIRTPYLRSYMYRFQNSHWRALRFFGYLMSDIDLWVFQIVTYFKLKLEIKSFDVVEVCGLPLLAALLAKKGVSTVVRWPGTPDKKSVGLMQRCSHIIANGDAYRVIKNKIFPEVKFVNIGIQQNDFLPKKNYYSPMRHFLFVSRIVPIKNIPFLLDGFAAARTVFPDIELKIVGDGEKALLAELKQKAIELGISEKVKWCGHLSGENLARAYNEADCLVLTSEYDNFPNVIPEAMVTGLPVIATRVGGISTQIEHMKNGYLVESGNVKELASAFRFLIGSPNLGEQWGRNNREFALREYDWQNTAKRLIEIYQN